MKCIHIDFPNRHLHCESFVLKKEPWYSCSKRPVKFWEKENYNPLF